jgi:hypothetical protein
MTEGRRGFPADPAVRQTVRCFSLDFSSGVILGLDPRTHSRMRRRPRRPSSGDVNASHPLIFQQNPLPISPPSPTMPTILPSRPRIHRKALRRGGVGAGRGGMTRNLMPRACGKWSPSGDTGEMAGCRTDPVVSCPERRAGRACAAHKGIGIGGCVGIVRRHGERPGGGDTFHGAPRRARRLSNGTAHSGNRRRTPPFRSLQRDRSRGQKPPNGAPEGVT